MSAVPRPHLVPLFDFDGTLVDSDLALLAPFLALGVDPGRIPPLGLPLVEACERVGIDGGRLRGALRPDGGAALRRRGRAGGAARRWGLASNKVRASGRRELERLGWAPTVALFSDDFGGAEKASAPLLDALGLEPDEVALRRRHRPRPGLRRDGRRPVRAGGLEPAGPRRRPDGDVVLDQPAEVLDLLAAVG